MSLGPALALTAVSGALYGLAFPPVGWWPLAWVALVPFLVAVRASRPRRALGLGVVLGITLSYGVGTWMPDAVVNYYQQSVAVGVLTSLLALPLDLVRTRRLRPSRHGHIAGRRSAHGDVDCQVAAACS